MMWVTTWRPKKLWFAVATAVLLLAGTASLLVWFLLPGFAQDFEQAVLSDFNPFDDEPTTIGTASISAPGGTASLEEIIVGSEVIARARFVSASRASLNIVMTLPNADRTVVSYYIPAMEYRFRMLEYLKGSGPNEVVAIVYERRGETFQTAEGARLLGTNLVAERDTTWDSREAVVFLQETSTIPGFVTSADRYFLGSEIAHAIDSPHAKRWLPTADAPSQTETRTTTTNVDSKKYLLDAPTGYSSSATTRSLPTTITNAPTIALGKLKQKIADLQAEVDAGDGSEEYRKCVYWKYALANQVEHVKEERGGDYYQYRDEAHIESGLPSAAEVAKDRQYEILLDSFGPDGGSQNYNLYGDDANLFVYTYPGLVTLARPLPESEFSVFLNVTSLRYMPCDAEPQEEKERAELVVTVTAPTGMLHEAFFDPIALNGGDVGATWEYGAIEPYEFTVVSDVVRIDGLEWLNGGVLLTLDGYVPLSGYTLDFIELDGSISTSLDFADALVNEAVGTWSWSVDSQPWEDGDLLMVRIRETDAAAG